MIKRKIWIEKNLVKGRDDRISGSRALGKALWSPRKGKRGADIYKNMREVKSGDLILHLTDNKKFFGTSIVSKEYQEVDGLQSTKWDVPCYLIELVDYKILDPPILRHQLLNQSNKAELLKIMKDSEVFYNRNLNLRQGAYLTPCPVDLFCIINKIYRSESGASLPNSENIECPDAINSTFNCQYFVRDLGASGLRLAKNVISRFTSSLSSKPFLIVTGLSGSGKTKLAQAFAMWMCEKEGQESENSQYRLVPVGADWTSREPLLGFPNGLDNKEYVKPDTGVLDLLIEASRLENNHKPYFLILDEMNLSHVERYFADFLSVMESEDKIKLYDGKQRTSSDGKEIPKEIAFPKNLFVIGTVNIDETTYMFSPKVLDRANVIEFRVSKTEMENYLSINETLKIDDLKGAGSSQAESFLALSRDKTLKADEDTLNQINTELILFFSELQKVGAEFGYRSAGEILRFAAIVKRLDPEWNANDIIDAALMQKLLPKVHGSRRKLEPVLKKLAVLCVNGETNIDELITKELIEEELNQVKYPQSFDKIRRMYSNLLSNGFTSYAEA